MTLQEWFEAFREDKDNPWGKFLTSVLVLTCLSGSVYCIWMGVHDLLEIYAAR